MSGFSLFTLSWIVWAAITVAFIAVMGWKTILGLREEDVVILDPAEAKQASEQRQIVAAVERLTSWAKITGFTSLGLLLVLLAVWTYQTLIHGTAA